MGKGLRDRTEELYHPEKILAFPLEEYRARMTTVREAMAKDKIDLLYCSAPESLFYLTGYESSWYRAGSPREWPPLSGLVIRQGADNAIFFEMIEEEVLVRTTSIITDVRILDFESSDYIIQFILKCLKEEGWLRGTIGLEKLSYRPHPHASQLLQSAFEREGLNVVDGSDVIRELRAVKSPLEMDCVRTASKIADIGLKAAIDHIRPGMTEIDLRAEIDYACARAGGENSGLATYVNTGPKSAANHMLASRRMIKQGDVVYVDLCGVYHRYHADLARTLAMGEPDPEVARQIDLSAKAWPILSKVIKPGCPFGQLAKTMKRYYEEVGIWEDRWWVGGYDIGIAFPPDWVGVFSYDPETDSENRLIIPGTVVNYESDFYLPKGAGMSAIMDTIAVSEDKAEILSGIPQELIIIDT
jgi:Xaa-Pro aminopeptidase